MHVLVVVSYNYNMILSVFKSVNFANLKFDAVNISGFFPDHH